ncbi:hypothetical protein SOVF_206310 [Spinacia oleracea]|nr:hypothetical protein SOVF_206310 [Spinacia oleracea]
MASPISIGAPQPWPSTSSSSKTYNFCSLGCSFNCPQLCIFPPPPPLFLNPGEGDGDDDGSSSHISPLMAALIAVLAAAFLLLFYFTVISKLCRRRSRRRSSINNARFLDSETSDPLARVDSLIHDPTRPAAAAAGLDDAFIRQITVFKYRREDNLIDGTECAVCLTEFNEDENLRLMPNCEHAFHIPCIDTWLKTHSNCPLCRSTMNPAPPMRSSSNSNSNTNSNPNPNPGGVNTTSSVVAALRVERSYDTVMVIRELETRVRVVEAARDEVGGGDGCGNLEERETKLDINDDICDINNDNSR